MFGPRINYRSMTPQQKRTANIVGGIIALVVFAMAGGLYLWRLRHFPHTVATIEAVWEKEVHRKEKTIVTMADLSFTRTSPTGEAISCRYSFEIGTPRDGFQVGDKLEIVPATGTCQRVNIIGRSKPAP
ncbi:hypothetical protein [Pleomorphomonas sp. PLEO]|uniref:hypothetical protein n=1 Tax=Pleomorphomonas sp. PLEO TaxID=3239306 RepID=UPI00351EED60